MALLPVLPVLVVALVLVELVIRDSRWGVGLVLFIVALRLLHVEAEVVLVGFRVSASDVVGVALIVAAIARFLRQDALSGGQWALLVYGLLVLLGIVGGAGEFGAGAAVNEARKYVSFTGAALYGTTIQLTPATRSWIARAWVRLGVLVLVVVVLRWSLFFTGIGITALGVVDDMRVIPSFETLVLLQAVVIAVWTLVAVREPGTGAAWSSGSPPAVPAMPAHRLAWFAGAGAAAVLLLQHRTLWAELALVAVLLLVRVPSVGRRLLVWGTVGIVAATGLSLLVLGEGTETLVMDDLSDSASNVDTFSWRVEGWFDLYESQGPEDPQEWLLGRPFGGGFPRIVSGRLVDVSPHNFYLELLLRVGVLGLAVFLGVHAVAIVRLWRSRGGTPALRDDALAVILVISLVQNATSHPLVDQGLPLGLALAAVAAGRRTSAPRPAVPAGTRSP